jgi:hypothetical protein
MGSWLLVCAGMECHKVVKTFVLYYTHSDTMPRQSAAFLNKAITQHHHMYIGMD